VGAALNFDGPHSDEVRQFFIENALYWITTCHIDALRLDAAHAIVDCSAYPFLAELADVVHAQAERLQRQVYLIAESDLNDTRLLRAPVLGGYGLDAQWNDSFHHALHTLLTAERLGYYQDLGPWPISETPWRRATSTPASIPPFANAAMATRRTTSQPINLSSVRRTTIR
jgi:maltooligosyltrehalose trehalohydrolase